MISLASPAADRGLALGANQAAMAGAYFVGSILNGFLYQFVGDWAAYVAGALALLLSGLILLAMAPAAALADKASGEAA
jgi:MFS family permease